MQPTIPSKIAEFDTEDHLVNSIKPIDTAQSYARFSQDIYTQTHQEKKQQPTLPRQPPKEIQNQEEQQNQEESSSFQGLKRWKCDRSKWQVKCVMFVKLIAELILPLIFGLLFYVFQGQNKYNDDCSAQSFKMWAQAFSILLLIMSVINVIKLVGEYLIIRECDCDNVGVIIFVALSVEKIIGMGLIICIIGITVTDSDECGSLHRLAQAYYHFFFFLLFIGMLAKIYKKYKGLTNDSIYSFRYM